MKNSVLSRTDLERAGLDKIRWLTLPLTYLTGPIVIAASSLYKSKLLQKAIASFSAGMVLLYQVASITPPHVVNGLLQLLLVTLANLHTAEGM